MKNYNKHDHTHCFNQKESPCGVKGIHRCCLCLEPTPQLEECKCESFSKEILDTSECKVHKGDVISNEPEEWESRIKNGRDEETGIYHVDGAEYNVDEDKLISFIKSKIRKAEERGKLYYHASNVKFENEIYNSAITDAVEALDVYTWGNYNPAVVIRALKK